MPSKSKQQLKLVYAMRTKYKTKADTPDRWKWVWEEGWGKLEKDAPEKITESLFDLIYQSVIEEMNDNVKIVLDADGAEIKPNDNVIVKKTGQVFKVRKADPETNSVSVFFKDVSNAFEGEPGQYKANEVVKASESNKVKYLQKIKPVDQPI